MKRPRLIVLAAWGVTALGCNALLDNQAPYVVHTPTTTGGNSGATAGADFGAGGEGEPGAAGNPTSVLAGAPSGGEGGAIGAGAGDGGASVAVGGAAGAGGEGGGRDPAGWRFCRDLEISGAFPDVYSHRVALNADVLPPDEINSDLRDLRFYAGRCADPQALLAPLGMWVETAAPGGESVVWVRTSAQTSKLAMLYGNPTAASTSDGNAAFLLFDDFSGSELDPGKWIYKPGGSSCQKDSASVAQGVLTLEDAMSPDPLSKDCIGQARVTSTASFQPTASYGIRVDLLGLHFPHWGGLGSGFRAVRAGLLDGKATPTDAAYLGADETGMNVYTLSAISSSAASSKVDNGTNLAAEGLTLLWIPSQVSWPKAHIAVTDHIPSAALNVGLSALNWDPNRPSGMIVVDAVRVMRDVEPPPTYQIGPEQAL